jgi:uncharacterized protein YndB with AHSA1/START domain
MKNTLMFDFTVDKPNKTVHITREFAAELPLVWDAFTKKEILDQWWAPKPYMSETKEMNFVPGGRRLYAMVSPEGQKNWALHRYISINPKSNFKMRNSFADKDGKEDPQWPGSDWNLSFSEQNGRTIVRITIVNESLERMEKMIEMGFKEGFTATLDYLDKMLSKR